MSLQVPCKQPQTLCQNIMSRCLCQVCAPSIHSVAPAPFPAASNLALTILVPGPKIITRLKRTTSESPGSLQGAAADIKNWDGRLAMAVPSATPEGPSTSTRSTWPKAY